MKSKPHLPRVSQDIDLYAGCQLRKRRKELNLTQKEIANFLGITFQQVQKYENGSNRICASRLYTLCNLLNVGPSYFFKNFTYTSSYKEEESFLSDVNAADGSNLMDFISLYKQITNPIHKKIIIDILKSFIDKSPKITNNPIKNINME